MSQPKLIPVETDVLVVGGGLAGCMAAIHASLVCARHAFSPISTTSEMFNSSTLMLARILATFL